MSAEYVPKFVKFVPASELLPGSRICVVLPVLLFAVDHIYVFGEIVVDEFIGVHVIFSYPGVRFQSVTFPLDEVVCCPTPWFSGSSSDFSFSTVEDFLDFVVFFTINEVWGRWKWLFLVRERGWCIWCKQGFVKCGMYVPG